MRLVSPDRHVLPIHWSRLVNTTNKRTATGTAEPGGFTTRELLYILDALYGLPVIGADVVEVAPIYDSAAETTTLAAAEVAHSLLGLMVGTPVV